ncbi:MAG: type II toxin-antitoxin system HigB family toxin [Sphaerochaetaceae bacterium]|nr:type II toxin-antitoxin system HigB family toxin [Sphaerochaetaceae bacterium]
MRIIARKTLIDYRNKKPESEMALKSWYAEASHAQWKTPAEIKEQFKSASILKKNHVVFNICGNKFRLIVKINYEFALIYIRFIGTYAEYDAVDAEEI